MEAEEKDDEVGFMACAVVDALLTPEAVSKIRHDFTEAESNRLREDRGDETRGVCNETCVPHPKRGVPEAHGLLDGWDVVYP